MLDQEQLLCREPEVDRESVAPEPDQEWALLDRWPISGQECAALDRGPLALDLKAIDRVSAALDQESAVRDQELAVRDRVSTALDQEPAVLDLKTVDGQVMSPVDREVKASTAI